MSHIFPEVFDLNKKKNLQRNIIYHPDADFTTNKADLAILQLTNPIPKWTDFIMPACMPFSKYIHLF